MREVVEQLITNKYDYEKGSLDFSCTKLEMEIRQGEVREGSFRIFSTEGKYTKGYISSTDPRMECLTTEFVGNEEEIHFCFHGEHMEEGEVVRGEFCVVSNRGEYYLPFVVTVVYTVPDSSEGPIKNLFHFANLARSNWQEAVKIFYSPAFAKVLKNGDSHVYLTYLGLSAKEGNEQCVEEFLIANRKKQQVEYIPSKKNLLLEAPIGVAEEMLNIMRNGWGYTRLEVLTEGDFLYVEKTLITEDDFLGNYFSLPFYIDSSKLHAGKNFGKITLKSAYAQVDIPVEVREKVNLKLLVKARNRKKNIVKLMGLYEKFRMKKISSATWIKETIRIIDKLVAVDEKDAATRLFQAQMLITCERYNEAGWILEHVGDLLEGETSASMEAYYLYLNTLLKKDEFYTKDTAEKVMRIYREHGQDWRVAWLLLFLSEEYHRDPVAKWHFLETQIKNGCRSPLIYVEAVQLVNNNPTLLRKLGDFELQILNYAGKKGMISLEVLEQILYLTERVKEYSPILFDILTGCYEKKADVRVLKEICTLLIKGNKVGSKYFKWYAKGVEEELRIINIYEYFMLSMNLQEEQSIPKQALLYFSYQNNLDYEHSAYLYAYVAKQRFRAVDVYDSYHKRIEFFVKDQLQKKHINGDLAYLYQEFLEPQELNLPMAEALGAVLYSNEIRFKNSDIRNVVVCRAGMNKEAVYPVTNDKAIVSLYGMDYCLVFEDIYGNRFVNDTVYTKRALMEPERFVNTVSELVNDNLLLDIYLCEKEQEADEEMLRRWLRLLEQESITIEKKRDLTVKVLQYYFDKQDRTRLEEYLESLDGEKLTGKERAQVIRYLVLCDKFQEAYDWLTTYRVSGVEEKILLHLLEYRMEEIEHQYENMLLKYTYQLFVKGRYSSITIEYLMKHYQGLLRNMREIWKASKRYDLQRREFAERVLVQILFAGMYIGEQTEIFKEYVYAGATAQIEDAYLIKNSYDYFMNEQLLPQEILTEIGRLQKVEHSVPGVCKLAYLKYYADNQEEIQIGDREVICQFIEDLLQKEICLKCMVDLRRFSEHQMFLADKTIVEYQALDSGVVRLHYLIMKGNAETGEYITESMQSVAGKIFYKEFVLFGGESLQYYITEEFDGVERLTESGTCRKSEEYDGEQSGKYAMINDIILSKNMQDYSTFDTLLGEYYKKEFMTQKLFRL